MEPREQEEPGEELQRMAEEQMSDLESENESDKQQRSIRRRGRVAELYAAGTIQTAEDYYHAALVMLYGEDPQHYEQARRFGQRSAALGEPRSWSIVAAAWDRWLLAEKKPQRFGTQFIREAGRWSIGEVDPAVTDSERAMYGVPPLWVQRQNLEQLRRRDERD